MKSLYAECMRIKNLQANPMSVLTSFPCRADVVVRQSRRSLAVLLVLLAAGMTSTQAASIYSWVDANGVQHFSAMPPPDRDDYQIVSIDGTTTLLKRTDNPSVPASTESEPAAEAETVITAPDTTVTVIDPEVVARNCERARQNLFLIDSRRRIVITDDNGEQRRLDDNERLALMQKSQDYIDENCQN